MAERILLEGEAIRSYVGDQCAVRGIIHTEDDEAEDGGGDAEDVDSGLVPSCRRNRFLTCIDADVCFSAAFVDGNSLRAIVD